MEHQAVPAAMFLQLSDSLVFKNKMLEKWAVELSLFGSIVLLIILHWSSSKGRVKCESQIFKILFSLKLLIT